MQDRSRAGDRETPAARGPPREGECPGQGQAGLAAAGEAQSKVSPDGTRTGVFTRVCVCVLCSAVCVCT